MSNVIKLVNTVDQFQNNLLTNYTNFILSHFLQIKTSYYVFVIIDSVVHLFLTSLITYSTAYVHLYIREFDYLLLGLMS